MKFFKIQIVENFSYNEFNADITRALGNDNADITRALCNDNADITRAF